MISAVAKGLVRSGIGRILIVGVMRKNFDETFWTDSRLEMWGADEAFRRTSIPPDVVIVFFTRFIGHKIQWRIEKLLKKRADVTIEVHRRVEHTGQLKKLLAEICGIGAREERKPIEHKPFTPERLNRFILRHGNLKTEKPRSEVKKLLALALRKDIRAHKAEIMNAFLRLRREAIARV